MNAFWKDPHRRELIVAAAAGLLWALILYHLPAPSPLRGWEHRARATRSRPSAGGTVREATRAGVMTWVHVMRLRSLACTRHIPSPQPSPPGGGSRRF